MIIASEQISYKFVNSIKTNNIYGEGTGILVYGESIANMTVNGIIGLVENGLENITSSTEYDTSAILNFLVSIKSAIKPNFDKFAVGQLIKKYFETKS